MNNKEKVLKFLFEEPSREFHVRLLARLTGLNPNTVINVSDKLVTEELARKYKDKDRNLTIIKANSNKISYKNKKIAYNIEKIFNSGLIDHINDELSLPTIVLFGSYAKAENHPGSDIDLFVIAAEKKLLDLQKYENRLSAEIQVFVHTRREFRRLIRVNSELINNVINGHVLSGYLEVL